MKRPLLIMAIIVLAGTVCGIRETGLLVRAAAAAAIAALMIWIKCGVSDKDSPLSFYYGSGGRKLLLSCRQLLIMLTVCIFAAAFMRAAWISHSYNSGSSLEFFEQYRATNPGQFDYALYLKGQGISSSEQYEKMRNKSNGDACVEATVFKLTGSFRSMCGGIFDTYLSAHDAGIYKAVVLGDKSEIDDSVRDLYQDAGIAHLLAVSGLHVSLIGGGLNKLLRKRLTASHSAAAVSFVMLMYMIMTGASGSAVRAVIMLIFSLAAVVNGRTFDMRSALAASGIVIMFWRPYQIFSGGFQLSFGAVAAISLTGAGTVKRLELLLENAGRTGQGGSMRIKRISRRNRLPKAAVMFITSAGIQLTTLPIIAYHYFKFPVYGIFLNFIVIPLMGTVLASGLSVLAAGMFIKVFSVFGPALPGISSFCVMAAAPGHYILRFYEILSAASLKLPFSVVVTGRPSVMQIMIYYFLLAAVLYLGTGGCIVRKPEIFIRSLGLICGAVIISAELNYFDLTDFYVTVLDVGQGDGIVIKNGNTHILVDGGSTSRTSAGRDVLESFLLSKRISRLDMSIVSHPDKDHVSGLMYLFGNDSLILTERLVLPEPAEGNAAYDEIRSAFTVKSDADSIYYLHSGMTVMKDGDFLLKTVYAGTDSEETNRNSSVILLGKNDFTMLFTGDTTAEDEAMFCSELKKMLDSDEFDADGGITVLKAAHHGSSTSSSDMLVKTASPEYAVISCGKNNRYGHPHKETLERFEKYGVKVIQTQNAGAAVFSCGFTGD